VVVLVLVLVLVCGIILHTTILPINYYSSITMVFYYY